MLLQTGCWGLQYLGKTSRKQNSQDTAWKQTPAPAREGARCWKLEAALNVRCAMLSWAVPGCNKMLIPPNQLLNLTKLKQFVKQQHICCQPSITHHTHPDPPPSLRWEGDFSIFSVAAACQWFLTIPHIKCHLAWQILDHYPIWKQLCEKVESRHSLVVIVRLIITCTSCTWCSAGQWSAIISTNVAIFIRGQ